jgi:ubiquitin-protein ligase
MDRRITKELDFWLDKRDPDTLFYNYENQVFNYLLCVNQKIYQVKIHIGKHYPFFPPVIIYISDVDGLQKCDYRSKLKLPVIWRQHFNIQCPCCSTILTKWSPMYRLINVLNEVRENITYTQRIREILMARQLTRQIFGFYIPIEEFL